MFNDHVSHVFQSRLSQFFPAQSERGRGAGVDFARAAAAMLPACGLLGHWRLVCAFLDPGGSAAFPLGWRTLRFDGCRWFLFRGAHHWHLVCCGIDTGHAYLLPLVMAAIF